ncbi:hypothetical protein D3C76_1236180 [compost metagenome]
MLDPVVTEIAKMLTQHRLPAAHQAEGVFHLRAEAQHRRNIMKSFRQWDGVRDKTPRAAQHRAVRVDHRIIHTLQNIAVVQQKSVGYLAQLIQRLFVADHRRFTAQISGGHHQRASAVVHQQMLQRIGRQHYAEAIQAWRNPIGQRG